MIFAPDDMRDFPLQIVNHVHKMKNPRAVGAANGHVGMGDWIGEIEIDFAANDVVHNHVFARRTKSHCSLVFEDMPGVLELFQVALVKYRALALQIRSELAADMGAFIPIQPQPFQPLIDGGHRFLRVALAVGILDAQHEFSAVMPCKQPVKQGGARAADMQIPGRRWSKTNAYFSAHGKNDSPASYTDFPRVRAWRRHEGIATGHSIKILPARRRAC